MPKSTVMELNKIENLIEKYFDGNTNLTEENQIKLFFSQGIVPDHLKMYQPHFQFLRQAKTKRFQVNLNQIIEADKDTRSVIPKRKINYWISGIAASVILIMGVYWMNFSKNNSSKYIVYNAENSSQAEQEKAYQEVQKAMFILSKNLNSGMNNLGKLSKFEESKQKLRRK